MEPKDVEKLLVGKTIKTIKHYSYMGWAMCIDKIIFTDGTIAEFGGGADEAYIYAVTLPSGEYHGVDKGEGHGV